MFTTLDGLPDPGDVSEIEDDSNARADAYQTLVVDLRGIDAPEPDKLAVESWISSIEELVGTQQQAAHAAYSEDLDAYTAAVGELSSEIGIARTRGSSLGVNCP
jgi:hypothetical protein